MKLIITNATEILQSPTLDLLKDLALAIPLNQPEYEIDLPIKTYPHEPFSIHDNTLYAGLQWIGTLSERPNPTSQETETTVHLNYKLADEYLSRYGKNLQPTVLSAEKMGTPVISHQAQSASSTTDNVANHITFNPNTFPTGGIFFSQGSSNKPIDPQKHKKSPYHR